MILLLVSKTVFSYPYSFNMTLGRFIDFENVKRNFLKKKKQQILSRNYWNSFSKHAVHFHEVPL
jgi:hypothetical protein